MLKMSCVGNAMGRTNDKIAPSIGKIALIYCAHTTLVER